MMKRLAGPVLSSNWGGPLRLILLAALLVPMLGAAPAWAVSPRAHPALLQIAAERPGLLVGVIVQKATRSDGPEKMVVDMGGEITKDLHIINAFAALIPAGSVVELARSPEVRWVSIDASVKQTSLTAVSTTWATQLGTQPVSLPFLNVGAIVDAAPGPNGTYGSGSNVAGSFTGFSVEHNPGHAITRVEVVLHAYANRSFEADDPTPTLRAYVAGQGGSTVSVSRSLLNSRVGQANAGLIYVDITSSRTWRWVDFESLELLINQGRLSLFHQVSYDAVGLRVTSDPGVDDSDGDLPAPLPAGYVDPGRLRNVYNRSVRAVDVWNEGPSYYQGQGIGVAVVDSGLFKTADLGRRVVAKANFNSSTHRSNDGYGHGTFIAGILAGDGSHSQGQYIGIAPKVNVINVRVSDDQGMATESDVVEGLQWILRKKDRYNIRVVNISLNSSQQQSYHTSPMNAAAEVLWFNGIVVVVSAGNNGSANLFPPANDPFVITVGATNDMGTPSITDDVVAHFSAFGATPNGTAKPDLVAPGTNIVSLLPENDRLTISQQHPANRLDRNYFRMSGTSAAAPMVSGAAALLLQSNPTLNPDQVKHRLKATAARTEGWPGYNPVTAGAGYLDVYAAVRGTSLLTANTGIPSSQLLWTGQETPTWNSINWNSINWNSINWNSINWNSINWNSINWNSDYWGP